MRRVQSGLGSGLTMSLCSPSERPLRVNPSTEEPGNRVSRGITITVSDCIVHVVT